MEKAKKEKAKTASAAGSRVKKTKTKSAPSSAEVSSGKPVSAEKPVKAVKPRAARKTKAKESAVVTAQATKPAKTVKPKRKAPAKKKTAPKAVAAKSGASVKEAKPAVAPVAAQLGVKPAAPAVSSVPAQGAAVPAAKPVVPAAKPVPAPVVRPKVVSQAAPAPAPASVPVSAPAPAATNEIEVEFPISVKDLAVKLQMKPSILIKDLMMMGVMASINNNLDKETVGKVCVKYGCTLKEALNKEETALSEHQEADDPGELVTRAPIVTIMGHVDHGKTSILDAIRKSHVAEREYGGITQHIGAYRVKVNNNEITFLDTPGHEVFTAMRARGAQVTDIVIIVVAADDGVMPQTKEAIDHAKAAGVSIVVALNKMDKSGADPDRVKKQLAALGLMAEDWGGKTITVPVSAKTGQGISDLLEMVLLEAQMLELKANPNRAGRGIVLESKLVKNRGPVATFLVQNGTLRLNDTVIVGSFLGKIRAMFNDRGKNVTSAGPACPAEVLGIAGVPEAGEQFYVVRDEKLAKTIIEQRREAIRQKDMQPVKRIGLEDLYAQIKEGKIKELKIILKADAQGSVEAIKEAVSKVYSNEVQIVIIHDGVGNITSSDVVLAVASEAQILGFNVVVDDAAKELVSKEGQEVRLYNVIYELVNEIKAALEGMLEPKLKKMFMGKADIKKVFRLSSGIIAGCQVSKGTINRHYSVSIVRNGKSVYDGELSSLKRFKDDVRQVEEGYECGMSFKGFNEVMEGDIVEAYEIKKIARTLD